MTNKFIQSIILGLYIYFLSSCHSNYHSVILTEDKTIMIIGKVDKKAIDVYTSSDSIRSAYITNENFRLVSPYLLTWKNLRKIEISGVRSDFCQYLALPLTQIEDLTIVDSSSKTLPNCLTNLSNLKRLEIALMPNLNWDIAFDQLSQLHSLKALELTSNSIEMLSDKVVKLDQLKKLTITNNLLNTVPEPLKIMTSLEYLSLDKNKITDIDSFMNSETAYELRFISFSYNQIKRFTINPQKEYKVNTLALNSNQITLLNLNYLENMPNLESVLFSNNPVESIVMPTTISNLKIQYIALPCNIMRRGYFEKMKQNYPKAIAYCSYS